LSVGAWTLLIWQSNKLAGNMSGLTMGMSAALFVALWVAMMVAMMFPSAAPMILTFARVHSSKREQGRPFVPTWVFVAAYLAMWTLFGIVAYLGAVTSDSIGGSQGWFVQNGARLTGTLLAAAGVYQLTPLKRACLAKCRTPLAFIMTSWRDGYGGAVRMGLSHGAYCLGCCWFLFVILFPLGMMNIAILGIVTLVVFAEKSLVFGVRLSQMTAVALILYGAVVIFFPDALPSMASDGAKMKM
jgi:predicted metal-binding membrane protein